MRSRWFLFVFTCLTVMALAGDCAAAQEQASTTLLLDNFAKDSGLKTTLWTTNSTFLDSLGKASSNPPGTFVPPQLTFDFDVSGMHMTGISKDYELTGVQSLATFSPPIHVVIFATPVKGTANPFEIFLASADLTQFVTLSANVNQTYRGFWADAPNVGQLWQLGEQFSPAIRPSFETLYKITLSIDTTGGATATVEDVFAGTVLGSLSNLQVGGTGPFYLVLGQRIGLATARPQLADWSYVTVTGP
jgi:hypothetical protein